MKFARISLLRILFSQRRRSQGSVTIGNKIKVLLLHVVALEECLDSRPGNVAERRRREKLIGYAHFLPSDLVLSSPQRVGTNTKAAGVI